MNSVAQFLKRLAQILFFLVVVVFLGSLLIGVGGLIPRRLSVPPLKKWRKPSILALDLGRDHSGHARYRRKSPQNTEQKTISRAFCSASTRRAAWWDRVKNFGRS